MPYPYVAAKSLRSSKGTRVPKNKQPRLWRIH